LCTQVASGLAERRFGLGGGAATDESRDQNAAAADGCGKLDHGGHGSRFTLWTRFPLRAAATVPMYHAEMKASTWWTASAPFDANALRLGMP
jgi:hypothetical protein